MECGPAVKRMNAVCSNVDATEMILLSESERERHTPCDTAYMWNMKNKWTFYEAETGLTDRGADLGLPRGGRGWSRGRPECGMDANSYVQGGYTTRPTILLYSKSCDKP